MNKVKTERKSAGNYRVWVAGFEFELEDSHPEYCGVCREEAWVLWNKHYKEIYRFSVKKNALEFLARASEKELVELAKPYDPTE